ncbi:MAG: TetR/AcrR family transcriptional regulator [Planctomycetota bacterium]
MVQQRAKERGGNGRLLERKREILRAASTIFRNKGFHEAGMRQIAADLGMTVGNLYYYFRSKQDLLAFCQEDSLNRLLRIADCVSHLDVSPAQRLWLFVYGHVCSLNESIPGSLAHLDIDSLEAADRERIMTLRDRYEEELDRILTDGMRQGLLRSSDARVAALTILGAMNWTVTWYQPDGRLPLRAIAEQFATQLTRGILADGVTLEVPHREVAVIPVEPSSPTEAASRK